MQTAVKSVPVTVDQWHPRFTIFPLNVGTTQGKPISTGWFGRYEQRILGRNTLSSFEEVQRRPTNHADYPTFEPFSRVDCVEGE